MLLPTCSKTSFLLLPKLLQSSFAQFHPFVPLQEGVLRLHCGLARSPCVIEHGGRKVRAVPGSRWPPIFVHLVISCCCNMFFVCSRGGGVSHRVYRAHLRSRTQPRTGGLRSLRARRTCGGPPWQHFRQASECSGQVGDVLEQLLFFRALLVGPRRAQIRAVLTAELGYQEIASIPDGADGKRVAGCFI
uniref:Uncharacterized protein n=1 Tax=Ixodes ricinus TaxID=34613 RepID=A0A6B0V0J0_IXORI